MKIKDTKTALGAGMVSKQRNGNYIARWGFYYKHGKSEDMYASKVKELLPNATIVHTGMKYTPFIGGAPLKNQSHFWVEFNLNSGATNEN